MPNKKIVILAGEPSHGADYHEYEQTARLFKVALEHSNVGDQVVVEYHVGGWPEDERTLETADLIVVYTDGRDGDLYRDVPFVASDRMNKMEHWMNRGCGLMLIHFSTFFTRAEGRCVMEWAGAYFEWEDEAGERNWYSRIDYGKRFQLSTLSHPIVQGVSQELALDDEVYYRLRFREQDPRVTPIGRIPEFADQDDPMADVVAWAVEREDGGRAFGTTLGHAYRLWKEEDYRRLLLNAIVWTAGLEVPEGGVRSRFYSDSELEQALAGVRGEERSKEVPEQIHILLLSGNEHHKWHNWEETTPEIVAALQADARVAVEVLLQADGIAELDLTRFDAIVLNYCNWHDPCGLSEPSKNNLLRYLQGGGGLAVLHFANGSFHYSLPEAGASDWPEFRKIVPRVWNHHRTSGHDDYGDFEVRPIQSAHPIVAGIEPFTIRDELYFDQEGDAAVDILCTARSKVTGEEEPLVWLHHYGAARVFQSLLGHSAAAYSPSEAKTILRRGVLWAARREETK